MQALYMIGNVTKDVEAGETPNGVAICRFDIAVNENYGDNKTTDYFKVITWRGLAENCGRYLKKGSKVAIMGKIHNRQYEDKNGNKKTITEITASEVEFLTPKQEEKEQVILEPIDDNEGLPF